MSTHVSGSAGVEFPVDVFGQARDAVWVEPRAREAETEWQLSGRICSEGSRNGRVRKLKWFKADATRRVGARY